MRVRRRHSDRGRRLSIGEEAQRTIVAAIRSARPYEICGLLTEGERGHYFIRLPNRAGVPGEAFVPDEELTAYLDHQTRQGRRVLGVVHSHPASAEPSLQDRLARSRLGLPMIIVAEHPEGVLETVWL